MCWRLLTSILLKNQDEVAMCIEWYSWRWTIEEVFKILKKKGANIEASELEYSSSVRKLSIIILETVIKIFLMRIAYNDPETVISTDSWFSELEQECLEHQIEKMEGKTDKLKNKHQKNDLKRYVWCIARLGGWKGYQSERKPGITTLWIGIMKFNSIMEGYLLYRDVSTR